MAAVVVDTCVVSFIFRRDSRAALYHRHLLGNALVISFMTLAELDRWALAHEWEERRRREMETYLRQYAIYPFDRDLCLRWAMAKDGARRNGFTVPTGDAWIAATALLYGLPLVTNNPRHYRGIPNLNVVTEAV